LFFLRAEVVIVVAKLPDVHVKNSIFFLHTSAERDILNISRCAIESAARKNPSTRIIVYSNAWNENDIVSLHPNVFLTTYNISEIFQGYPTFTQWYSSRLWKTGYPVINLADALRLVILHQSGGGSYLDTDVLVLRNFDSVTSNAVGIENVIKSVNGKGDTVMNDVTVNSAILVNFENRSEYLGALLKNFIDTFRGDIWGYNGPQLLSRVYVNLHDKVSSWHSDVFYPIHWKDAHILFEPVTEHEELIQQLYANSVTVHLWNSLISPQLPYTKSGSVLETLVKKVCPVSYLKHFNFGTPNTSGNTLENFIESNNYYHHVDSPGKNIAFTISSPMMTINYEHKTPNINLKVHFDEHDRNVMRQYEFCFDLKMQNAIIIENRCYEINANKNSYSFQFFKENPSLLKDGKYAFIGWIKDKISNYIASEMKIVGFHKGFRVYKRKMQQRKLKLFLYLMASRDKKRVHHVKSESSTAKEYFNVLFLYEKMVIDENKRVNMPAFKFIEKGLLPALHKFNGKYKNKRLKKWLFGPNHVGWNMSLTVTENLMHRFGGLSCLELVVVLPPPWPEDYNKYTNPTSIPPEEIKALSKVVPIAFRQAELRPVVTNQRLNLINATFLFSTEYVFLYLCTYTCIEVLN